MLHSVAMQFGLLSPQKCWRENMTRICPSSVKSRGALVGLPLPWSPKIGRKSCPSGFAQPGINEFELLLFALQFLLPSSILEPVQNFDPLVDHARRSNRYAGAKR